MIALSSTHKHSYRAYLPVGATATNHANHEVTKTMSEMLERVMWGRWTWRKGYEWKNLLQGQPVGWQLPDENECVVIWETAFQAEGTAGKKKKKKSLAQERMETSVAGSQWHSQEVTGDEMTAGREISVCSTWSAFIRALENSTILKISYQGEMRPPVFNRHDVFYQPRK